MRATVGRELIEGATKSTILNKKAVSIGLISDPFALFVVCDGKLRIRARCASIFFAKPRSSLPRLGGTN
jgi:hypothetical protein